MATSSIPTASAAPGRRCLRAALALGALLLTLSAGAPVAHAATLTVTNTNDSGAGSLRQAVLDANAAAGADTIDLAVAGTITLTSGQLDVTDDLTIDGPGAANLTISGNNASRVFQVAGGTTVDLKAVTVADGSAGPGGGGILNSGTLTVTDSTVSGNFVGGAPGGGIYNSGTLTVTDSTVSGNTAGSGGAIFNYPGTTLTVTDSTFAGNSSPNCGGNGGGIYNGPNATATVTNSTFSGSCMIAGAGIYNFYGAATVTNSTFSGNSAIAGGGIYTEFGALTVTNSTFSANSAANYGGGIVNFLNATTSVTNSTFSGNSAGVDGGGISNFQLPGYVGTVTLGNSIVANSPSGGNCSGAIIDVGGNLSWPDATCPGTNQDPMLGPLANNGGPTETMALPAGSPAVDAAVLANCPATDQRGVSRPQGAGCDIGSFEREAGPGPPAALTLTPPTDTNTAGAEHCVTATVEDASGDATPGIAVRFSVTGANSASGSDTTDSNGEASFCYTGTTAGNDSIHAFADTDGDSTQGAGEPDDTASKTYIAGAPASLTLSPPDAVNQVSTQHTVTATVKDAFGNPVSGTKARFTVTGSVSTSGSCTTASDGTCSFTYTGPDFPGADMISAFADTNDDGDRDSDEPVAAHEATKAWVLPTATAGHITGGGQVWNSTQTDRIAFGFDAKGDGSSSSGGCNVEDPSSDTHIKCVDVNVINQSGNSAVIYGDARVNGVATTYRIDVTDNGEPGSADVFKIKTASGYSVGGTIQKGNVQVH